MNKGTNYKTGPEQGINLRIGYEIEYRIFDQGINRVEKIVAFGLTRGKCFEKRAAHPRPSFL